MSRYHWNSVIKYLQSAVEAGELTRPTAEARISAVKVTFQNASESEQNDVQSVSVANLVNRYEASRNRPFQEKTRLTYVKRIEAAISGFEARMREADWPRNNGQSINSVTDIESKKPGVEPSNFPIPLRTDLTVSINGLPFDLTKAEAEKIANVIKALAQT